MASAQARGQALAVCFCLSPRFLDAAWRHLREARRFHAALVEGARSLVGRTVKLEVLKRSAPELASKVTEITGISAASTTPMIRPTPVSTGDAPRAYSPVNVFGRLEGDPRAFDAVPGGAGIEIEREE